MSDTQKTVVILSSHDIDNLKNYEYLIKEASDANHIALEKLIVLKDMVRYEKELEKELIVDILQASIELIRVAREQNNLLIKYTAREG